MQYNLSKRTAMFPHLILSLLALLALYQPTVHASSRLKRNDDDNGATTTLVSVTLTTTIHLTSPTPSNTNNAGGPCENFYGACVVYGGQGAAAYTTTVYATGPSPTPTPTTPSTTFTRTTTLLATTTVSDSGACADYSGACVVYATNGAAATTVYGGQQGNGQGFIGGGGQQGGQGFIGAAGRVDGRVCTGLVGGLVVGLVFAVGG